MAVTDRANALSLPVIQTSSTRGDVPYASRSAVARIGDDPVPDSVTLPVMLAVILGGNETTMNLIGNLMWRLLKQPELWRQVKEDPIPAGAKVMYNIVAVNQNPEVFDNPAEFRLDRPRGVARKHTSFGGGIHLCIGAGMARMEVKLAVQTLIARLPNLQLIGKPSGGRGSTSGRQRISRLGADSEPVIARGARPRGAPGAARAAPGRAQSASMIVTLGV